MTVLILTSSTMSDITRRTNAEAGVTLRAQVGEGLPLYASSFEHWQTSTSEHSARLRIPWA